MATSREREVVVITGVSYGLGLAMVKWFNANGHTVIGCARSHDKIEKINEEFASGKEKRQFYVVDISNDEAVKQWSQQVMLDFGAPSLLINNSGVTNKNANFWEVPTEEFNKVVDINIKGTANVLRHFLPSMIEAKRKGVIVNFTSGWGRCVAPEVAPYCTTKWALEGLSKALAEELPEYLTCVPVNPGIINTPMLQTNFGRQGASMFGNPEQWAKGACPYILSINHSMNGESLTCG
ncbi:predicted protein [Nematostella vectensis]|uniref:Uncharacterized protein n=1 Tax=Nematostella vectensis TaxID=45351 RepID=A7RMI5_NEMVE|nr:predicted protein [Nematostella vectensis]|eukprot:XP_001639338.1 predicted protein [Nematostella vectensis]